MSTQIKCVFAREAISSAVSFININEVNQRLLNYTISRPEHGYKLLHLPNYMPINIICYEGFTLMVVDNLNSLSDLDSQAILIYRDTSPFYQTKDSKYSYFYKKITVDTLNKQVK